ncbi:MAG: peptide deformylase [Gemmatales bacterium]|nr:peptide deformylase [Gemmatales bacterium]MDW8223786.1 peptide deformylase [Gemmatales bacterium]
MEIVHYPHPALRFPACPVRRVDENIRQLVHEMTRLLLEHHGLGLAAPQVGYPYQIFLMRPDRAQEDPGNIQVIVNPVLSEFRGSAEEDEGCLSFPGLYQKIRRAKTVHLRAFDLEGREIARTLSGLEARVAQHETDHLHGILFIDRMTEAARLASRDALDDLTRRYRDAQRRGKIPRDEVIIERLKELVSQQGAVTASLATPQAV